MFTLALGWLAQSIMTIGPLIISFKTFQNRVPYRPTAGRGRPDSVKN